MMTFALTPSFAGDPGGDIYLSAGQIALVQDGNECAQTIGTRLKTFLGEFFYDQNYGVPYWSALQNKGSVDALNLAMKRVIEGTAGVDKIVSFQSAVDRTNRLYSVTAIVSTIYSDDDVTINQNYEF